MHRNILCAPGDQKKQTKEQEELTQKEHRTGRYPGSAQIMHLPTLLPITNYRFLMLGQATNTLYQWTRLCMCMRAKSLQSFPTLCNPMDYSLSGSSVHGILQVRILEWVVMPSSRGSSQPRDRTHTSCPLHWQEDSSPQVPLGKPKIDSKDSLFSSWIYCSWRP